MREVRELTGQRFGKLVALRPARNRHLYWMMQCDCGNTVAVRESALFGVKPIRSCQCVLEGTRKAYEAKWNEFSTEWERRNKLKKEMKAAGYL